MLDAVGRTIHKIGNAQKNSKPEYRADKVIFIITTDGMENASREYTYDKVKKLIERQKSQYGWEFIFLGANIDSVEFAGHLGIARNRAQNFHNDRIGIALNLRVVSDAIAAHRLAPAGMPLDKNWGAKIEDDYRRRGSGHSK